MWQSVSTFLLIPQQLQKELQHILEWASANNLKPNNAKSLEIIVHYRHRKRQFTHPNVIPGNKRVHKLNVLGVTVSDTLSFHNHLDVVLEKTARSLYATKTIRAHGLDGNALLGVTRTTQTRRSPLRQATHSCSIAEWVMPHNALP